MPILTSVKFVKSDSVLFSPLASEVFCSEAGSPARSQGRSPNSSSWYSNLQSGLGVGVCPFVSLTVSPVLAQSLLPGSLSGRNSCSVGLRCHGGWSGGRGGDCPLSLARPVRGWKREPQVASQSWRFGGEGVGSSDRHCNLPFRSLSIISGFIEEILLDMFYRSRISAMGLD